MEVLGFVFGASAMPFAIMAWTRVVSLTKASASPLPSGLAAIV